MNGNNTRNGTKHRKANRKSFYEIIDRQMGRLKKIRSNLIVAHE